MLGAALVVVTLFALLCGLAPLCLHGRPRAGARSVPYFSFFLAIGLGFMLVEMSQVQRLSLYLGHPTYGLAVVLSSLLLASGAGSALSQRVRAGREPWALAALLAVLAIFGAATPHAIRGLAEATMPARIALAVGLLLPIGLFMGMAFPLGMRVTQRHVPALAAWLWGVNGAASVWASVVSVAIAITLGISAAFWAGMACYVLALASLGRMVRTA